MKRQPIVLPPICKCRTLRHEPPADCHPVRQHRSFHRPLRDAHFCGSGHRDGAGFQPWLRGDAALRDAGLRRLRCGLARRRLARRPLEPPAHDGDLLHRHRLQHDQRRLRADAAATRRRAVRDRRVRLDLSSGRHGDDRLSRRADRPRGRHQRRLGQSRRRTVGAGHGRDGAISRLALGVHRARHRHDRHRPRLHAGDPA